MSTIRELQDKILELKKQKGVSILAHSYQAKEIIEVADISGDSFQLSLAAQKVPEKTVILCGVHFMAETVKILSPEKKVILANPVAGCPMAEQIEPELLEHMKKSYPDYTVVAYVNTTAALKTLCDVCVTSSSAVKIVRNIPNDKILFIPDCNLGQYVASQLPEKTLKFVQGGCPIHAAVTVADVNAAKLRHPNALLLVHPECVPAVVAEADFVGSTSAIMDYAKQSDAKEFIIGTEMSIAEHLAYACPDKKFFMLSKKLLCMNMKITTLVDVYNSLTGEGGEEIVMGDELIAKARVCIDEMVRLGK
jgi:quinolinate synthase